MIKNKPIFFTLIFLFTLFSQPTKLKASSFPQIKIFQIEDAQNQSSKAQEKSGQKLKTIP